MALLQINAEWRIKSDPRNWILQRKATAEEFVDSDESAKDGWKNVSYYSDLPDAVQGMVKREIKIPADLRGVLAKLEELYILINERFSSVSLQSEPEKPEKVEEIDDFLL